MLRRLVPVFSLFLTVFSLPTPSLAAPPTDKTVSCDLLVAGGGLSGAATAYEALLAGKTVCLTEITDWLGGQISAQGTSALDERPTQRRLLYYPRGYLELRNRIKEYYGELNPGDCWVSESCFIPADAHEILKNQLLAAEEKGEGTLKWFPSTVIKELETNGEGSIIETVTAIQHQPRENAPPLNTDPLSETFKDWYRYQDSKQFEKTIIQFVPSQTYQNWYVVDATETGELVGLADVPYRLGIDPRSYQEPSSASQTRDPYCTQGFTYTFAMEATKTPQTHEKPPFYEQYQPYYSYELERLASFDLVFTYRRIWSPETGDQEKFGGIGFTEPTPGDISMQNWTWGNDYRPGTAKDNLIYTRQQLQERGQLSPGGWEGGLRVNTLAKGEENAWGFFYWLVEGTTDSQLGEDVKTPNPKNRFLSGLDSPMGTVHGLSKYPYIREGRRIIGRPAYGYPEGFTVWEVDISRQDYTRDYYRKVLSPEQYQNLQQEIAGRDAFAVIQGEEGKNRSRARIYPDSVGIAHYAIDFHPCMREHPPEKPGNTEREGTRQGAGQAYPFQIPLRALIPQEIDNFLVAGKSIATSHIAAAAYRVHSFEWSVGAAAGTTVAFALENQIFPYQLVDEQLIKEQQLQQLRERLQKNGNPTAFPGTSIFNNNWEDWQ
ncbi:MAG: FAD-dependent oxidoreductase [Cyanobacteria bacterium SW_9_44_58]|nr:MAG: FAD-dependent oxidoreductase [Cyanobacteria bacterium SW_9_44_58]